MRAGPQGHLMEMLLWPLPMTLKPAIGIKVRILPL
jgi:hypothetical protein